MNDSKEKTSELAVITTYFNPQGYKTKRSNFSAFLKPLLESNLFVIVVEADFPPNHLALSEIVNIIRLQGRHVLWQKERMLNIALAKIPRKFQKIAWIDADILFENRNWVSETIRLLDESHVVQLFEEAVRLPKGVVQYSGQGETYNSFGSVIKKDPNCLIKGDFQKHGHTGFGWAVRREVIETLGFYDANIAGSGDHVMAHAFAGDWDSECIKRIIGNNPHHLKHFQTWAEEIYSKVRAKISYVPGRVMHLWHGDTENRKYVVRNKELADFKYNPYKDIELAENGLWQWTRKGNRIRIWAENYFSTRKEDGDTSNS